MTHLPDNFLKALPRLRERPDHGALRAHAAKLQEQCELTRVELDRIEFLLGRTVTTGELNWIHRRLHYGLQFPDDAELDYDLESLDAAYRERLARSGGTWRGQLDDIPSQLRDLMNDDSS